MYRISRLKPLLVNTILCVFLFSSCNNESPENIAVKFLEFENSEEPQRAYELLSNEDKEYKSLEEFSSPANNAKPVLKAILKKLENSVKYEVVSVEGGDTLNVKVQVTEPDFQKIRNSVFSLESSFSMYGKSEDEILNIFLKKLDGYIAENKEIPTETSEKTIRMIREEGTLKIFKNYALPVRKQEISKKITSDKNQLMYEEAKKSIDNFNSKYQVEYFKDELASLESIINNKVSLGNSIKIGSLEITPKTVQVANLNYFKHSYRKVENKVTDEKCLILKYTVKNISKGQVFSPNDFNQKYQLHSTVIDNHQNEMKYFHLGYNSYADKDYELKLQPGQEIEMTAVCHTPANESAEKFLWKLKRRINNQPNDYTDFIYVSFDGSDIKYQ